MFSFLGAFFTPVLQAIHWHHATGFHMENKLPFFRLCPDAAGVSHFKPMEVEVFLREFAPPAAAFSVSELKPASRHGFLCLPGGWVGELHPSPMRMWIVVVSGEMEFKAGDGATQRLLPGSALLLEDTTGMGHCSKVLGSCPAVLSVVHVD